MSKELRALAMAAKPGPWTIHAEEVISPIVAAMELSKLAHGSVFTPVLPMVVGSNGLATAVTGCGPTSVSNAAYIAACSPDVVLALLDRIDRLELHIKHIGNDALRAQCSRQERVMREAKEEFKEITEWTRTEKCALRDQEIRSIFTHIAAIEKELGE